MQLSALTCAIFWLTWRHSNIHLRHIWSHCCLARICFWDSVSLHSQAQFFHHVIRQQLDINTHTFSLGPLLACFDDVEICLALNLLRFNTKDSPLTQKLPLRIRQASSLPNFKTCLKTHFYSLISTRHETSFISYVICFELFYFNTVFKLF